MSEREIYLTYMPQITGLIMEMDENEYISWKRETLETTTKEVMDFMKKIFMISDKIRHCEWLKLLQKELCQ